jgi:SWI/SNF-related matrix-associated actin-dependent regulator 1 of chromatin subfamily A
MLIESIELFPYQKDGARWLAERQTALLADEMGLGKSAQAIHAADLANAGRILILCPASLRQNWERELLRFSSRERLVQIIMNRSARWSKDASIICSYDLAIEHPKDAGEFDLLVLDEVHYLKSPKAKRTKAVFGTKGWVRKAKRVWAMSGTPAPNHAAELWILLYTFGMTKLGYGEFVDRFCTTYDSGYGLVVTGTKRERMSELKELLSRLMLRRRKEEVMKELPPITYQDLVVEPSEVDLEVEASFIQYVFPADRRSDLWRKLEMEKALIHELVKSHGGFKDSVMKGLEALAQSVSTLRRYTGLQKVPEAAKLIASELESNAYDKVVIFAIHRDVIEGMRARLAAFGPVTLYGKTDADKKDRNVKKFQENEKTRVFIGNILAAGTGITLTAAHQVVFVEQDWVPGNNAQAMMRCHRIGQTKPVTVRFFGLSNSLDERVAQILKRKTRELTEIFDDRVL